MAGARYVQSVYPQLLGPPGKHAPSPHRGPTQNSDESDFLFALVCRQCLFALSPESKRKKSFTCNGSIQLPRIAFKNCASFQRKSKRQLSVPNSLGNILPLILLCILLPAFHRWLGYLGEYSGFSFGLGSGFVLRATLS
jgi:hypothetical protein